MSQELIFTSNNINIDGSNDIKGQIFACYYLPNMDELKMNLNELTIDENSSVRFKIILNNQFPNIDISNQFITKVTINGINISKIKFNNEYENISTPHYILQEFIIHRNKLNDYEIWSKITKNPIKEEEYDKRVDIITINKWFNNKVFYDVSYRDYYTNVGEFKENIDRNYVDISFSSNVEEDIADFDEFIVNLYEEDGDLVDTSGNENDASINTILRTNSNFNISNLRSDISYNIKVYPVINSSNNYNITFNDFFRLNEVHIYTDISMNTMEIKNKIESIKYKYLTNDINYSSVNLDKGCQILNEIETNDIHKFRIITPNIYKCFNIKLVNSENILNIKLIGDKNKRL